MYELWKWIGDKWTGEWTLVGQYSTERQALRIARDYKQRGETVRIENEGTICLHNGDIWSRPSDRIL